MMLLLLSPSKKLDESSVFPQEGLTEPELQLEAEKLMDILKGKSVVDLQSLMGLSDKLAHLNYERNQHFDDTSTRRPALFLFKGDVYDKMDVADYSAAERAFAQGHVRILSGLYGVLRPMDMMQPYRLEMGTKLKNTMGSTLYDFWGADIADALNDVGADVIVNLASQEYFKAVDKKALKTPVLTIHFKQLRDGNLKTIGLMAKRARGAMANYVVRHAITDVQALKDFSDMGYTFQENLSDASNWVFVSHV